MVRVMDLWPFLATHAQVELALAGCCNAAFLLLNVLVLRKTRREYMRLRQAQLRPSAGPVTAVLSARFKEPQKA